MKRILTILSAVLLIFLAGCSSKDGSKTYVLEKSGVKTEITVYYESHVGLNDNVVEGLTCKDIPAFSVQYHPEAAAGPHDSAYLFDRFIDLMVATKTAKEA